MNLLAKILIIGSLFLLAMGFWGRVHIVISGSLIMKGMGIIGLIAGLSLLFTGNNNNHRERY